MPNDEKTKQQIRVVAEKLDLDEYVIEKDLCVTKAISQMNSSVSFLKSC
ncbi:MAG: hypothetical protein K0U29_00865 [Gammaproteobacteria bacterium]|nr:hypothetical protein [Gammaproteobacteria bacterium]MCH9743457.1 hypothetical protein [Gammaproteobacteria bacterium]